MNRRAMMSIPYKNSGIPVYITRKDSRSRPTVILIHEVWGLNEHIKDIADRLCEEGFMVLAPDLLAGTKMEEVLDPSLQKVIFDEKERLKHQQEIRKMWTPLKAPGFAQETINKLLACYDYLLSQDQIGKIGVIGFCFGGTYSFNLAINQPCLAAAVVFYGHFDHDNHELSRIMSPMLAFYGEKDTSLVDQLPEIDIRMKKAQKDFTYKVYPDCGHAFFNDTNPLTYNKKAASDSWKLAIKFLKSTLKAS
jgi:carboxymethylenebutenolidase